MNLLFGSAATGESRERFSRGSARLSEQYETTAHALRSNDERIECGYLTNHGAVLGTADREGVSLAYVGSFLNGLPQWSDGSPLDDPNRTAHYLLQRYQARELAFLDGLVGHFAVALIDRPRGRLVLAVDPFGQRQLFYRHRFEEITFATKLGAMPALLGDEAEMDRSLEDFLLGCEFLPWNRTLYRDVRVMPSGTLLKWENGELETRPVARGNPWSERFAAVDPAEGSEAEIVDALHDMFVQAIDEMCPTNGKVAVLLGGFDSALIASVLKDRGRHVETFSFHFEDDRFNQPKVEELAAHLRIRHHWVSIQPSVIRDGLSHFAEWFNQPAGQPHYLIETAHVCSQIREEGFVHCLSGDGCDGIFLGYPTVYRRAKLIRLLSRTPKWVQRVGGRLARSRRLERRFGHPYRIARNVLTILGRESPTREHIAHRIFDDFSLSCLREDLPPEQEKPFEDILTELAQGLEELSVVRLAYRGKSVVGLNRSKLLGSSDLSGVVLHSPYLHPGLVDVVQQLPDRLCRPQDRGRKSVTGKYILMKMVEQKGLLPTDIIHQAKRSPVHAPVDGWYAGCLRDVLLDLAEGLPFEYDHRYVEDFLRPKLAEEVYRNRVALDNLASHAIALLATYARFSELTNGR